MKLNHITVYWGYAGSGKNGWWAKLYWQDGKFAEDGAVEGVIKTRYGSKNISDSIDYVLEIADIFGLPKPSESCPVFKIFYRKDGMEVQKYPPPEGWKEILQKEANKRGWLNNETGKE